MGINNDSLEKIKKDLINLKGSDLYRLRIENNWKPVLGEGDANADIMLIGEAPGKNEAEQGRPFCGASGRVLDNMLHGAGLDREEVYITALVKDRPPNNRDPKAGEIELYAPLLDRQINVIKPRMLILLGRFASQYIMNKFKLGDKFISMSKTHGKVFEADTEYGKIEIMPVYHPAAALYSTKGRKAVENDFKKLKEILNN
ncbi:MAG: uracil-DNA glycosylase [Candidatus Spechtbacterales bacterium]|nr:uracil-DNA glycosylase [Candidatus Spechtbacterales bacterium]